MRHTFLTTILISLFFICFGQIAPTDKDAAQAIKGAVQYLQSIMGNDLYNRYISLDYENSRELSRMVYSTNFNPQYLRTDKYYEISFYLVKAADTITYINLFVDAKGHLSKYDDGAVSLTPPELIIGYKKMLTGNLKIDYRKAKAIGREKGFKGNPFLQAETEAKVITVNNYSYVRIKYFWSFSELQANGGSADLDINAETGKIERERYTPPMPK